MFNSHKVLGFVGFFVCFFCLGFFCCKHLLLIEISNPMWHLKVIIKHIKLAQVIKENLLLLVGAIFFFDKIQKF